MKDFVAFLAGALFAVGLVVGGMTQPAKVIGFLDFFGNWDPSLAFVMGGAVLVNVIVYRLTTKRERPVLEHRFHIPSRKDINWQLVGGGALFGIGWGLAGYCPGPAIASIGTKALPVAGFVIGMAGGMYLHTLFERHVLGRRAPEPSEDGDGADLAGQSIHVGTTDA